MILHFRPGNGTLERWIKGIASGDRDALGKLYEATSTDVYAYAHSLVRNDHDAQDVLHECYVTIWRSAGTYRCGGKAMAWIITITRNLCYKYIYQQNRFCPLNENVLGDAGDSGSETAMLLRSCLQLLNAEEHQIVVLHAISGYSFREIATHLGLKVPTVASRYRRALQKLRDNF